MSITPQLAIAPSTYAPARSFDFALDFLSGGIAGIISKTASAPLERVKLLLQTQHTNDRVTKPYKGIGDCFSRILKEEGVRAFWRGNMANIIRYFPTQALNFSIKDHIQAIFPRVDRIQNPYKFVAKNLLAGGLAGSVTSLVIYPLDFARTRLGTDIGKDGQRLYTGVKDCLVKTYKSSGLKGLYGGASASVFGIFMYRGLYFGVYDSAKPVVMKEGDSIVKKFFFAQFCVIFSETIAYPTDTVKRMLMLQSSRKEVMYNGAFDCVSKIYQKDGLSGFWRGNLSNMMRSVGSSLCLVLYDEFKAHRGKLF